MSVCGWYGSASKDPFLSLPPDWPHDRFQHLALQVVRLHAESGSSRGPPLSPVKSVIGHFARGCRYLGIFLTVLIASPHPGSKMHQESRRSSRQQQLSRTRGRPNQSSATEWISSGKSSWRTWQPSLRLLPQLRGPRYAAGNGWIWTPHLEWIALANGDPLLDTSNDDGMQQQPVSCEKAHYIV